MASLIVAQLLFLESENPTKDIYMYINSPGGVVTAGMAIHDTMQLHPAARRHGLHRPGRLDGQPSSSRPVSRGCGSRSPMRAIMIHQPSGGAQRHGQQTSRSRRARFLRIRQSYERVCMAGFTGQHDRRRSRRRCRTRHSSSRALDEAQGIRPWSIEVFDKRPAPADEEASLKRAA